MICKLLLFSAAAIALLSGVTSASASDSDQHLKVVDHIPGPDGRWDYASYDASRRRIYIAEDNVVLAVNLTTDKLNAHFAAGDGLHEVVVVPGHDLLVTTNSGDSTVKILRASNGSLIRSLRVPADPDGAAYDPATKLVVVINGDAGVLTLIDPVKERVVGDIRIGGKLEYGQPDGKGRFYVNLVDRGQVAVVDLVHRKVLRRYVMAGCQHPTGLAYVEGGRVISSCQGVAKVLDAASGRQIASLAIGGFPDAVLYDAPRHRAYIPTALDGKLWVIALDGPKNNRIVYSVPTQQGARTGAVDLASGRVYLPTAEYAPLIPPFKKPPTPKPGTFQILVLSH